MLDHECSPECETHPAMRALHMPHPDVDERELMAYARGWLDGYQRAHADGFAAGVDASAEHWTECVRRANRQSERAGARKAWDQAVRRGENPGVQQ